MTAATRTATSPTPTAKVIHVVVDDKFIDMAAREFELVAPGVHEYLILGTKPPFRHLKSTPARLVDLAGFEAAVSGPEVRGVIFHSLPPVNLQALARVPRLPQGPTTIWLGWGYDYYGALSDAFPDGLIQPKTAALLQRLRPAVADAPGVALLSQARPYRKPTAGESRALQRIDVFSPVLDTEYTLMQQNQPGFRARYHRWNYGTAEDDFALDAAAVPSPPGPNLLLGNSATPTNNHLELFDLIREQKLPLEGRKIIAPLSYGDPAYARAVARLGHEAFGDAFVPLLDYMPKERYIETLASCGTLLLNTVRQQALGNVYISLQLGARVFLHRQCPLRGWLRRQGVPVGDVERIEIQPLSAAQREAQSSALRAAVGRDAQRQRTRSLVSVALGSAEPSRAGDVLK